MAIPLYKIPEVLEEAEFLDGSILPAYQESLKSMNPRAQQTLGKYAVVDGDLAGSSPLMQIHLLNSGVLPKGTRLATRQDLQTAVANDETGQFMSGRYNDFGIALRSAGDSYEPNTMIAKRLAKQLKERDISFKNGVLIPLAVLKDSDDPNEPYGVTLDFNDNATHDTIRPLGEYIWNWTRDGGLACADLCSRGWGSNIERLGWSGDSGRVVVVRAAGTPRKILEARLSDYASQHEAARNEYNGKLAALRDKITAELQ